MSRLVDGRREHAALVPLSAVAEESADARLARQLQDSELRAANAHIDRVLTADMLRYATRVRN